jgi:hypothetical protein
VETVRPSWTFVSNQKITRHLCLSTTRRHEGVWWAWSRSARDGECSLLQCGRVTPGGYATRTGCGPRSVWMFCTCRESNFASSGAYVSKILRTEREWPYFHNVILCKAIFQVLKASMKRPVFWDVAPCSLADINRHWQDFVAGGSKHLWNTCLYLPDTRRNFPEDSHFYSIILQINAIFLWSKVVHLPEAVQTSLKRR